MKSGFRCFTFHILSFTTKISQHCVCYIR